MASRRHALLSYRMMRKTLQYLYKMKRETGSERGKDKARKHKIRRNKQRKTLFVAANPKYQTLVDDR